MKFICLIIIATLISCSKKEEPIVEIEDVIIEATFSDFGGVLVGNEKTTAIKITNKTKGRISFLTEMTEPFFFSSLSQNCMNKIIKVGETCIMSMKFKPVLPGNYSITLPFWNKEITIKGAGLENGYLLLSDYNWSMGTFPSGSKISKTFVLTNHGDLSVGFPSFSFPSSISIGVNRCGAMIHSKTSCEIILESQITSAGVFNSHIDFSSNGGGTGRINYSANVTPSGASGLITFDSVPVKMSAVGEEFLFTTKPIKDVFGNIVPLGTRIFLEINENLMSLDGSFFDTNEFGVISFRIRTKTIKGEGIVSLSSNQASGYLSFPITAGEAFGPISIKSFTNNIPANGMTQTVISTNTIYDQYNNIIENGSEIIFEVIGDATIGTAISPKIRNRVSIDGMSFVTLTAGTTATSVLVKIYSGPIKNELNEIVGYKANGEVTVNIKPGLPYGEINLSSNVNAIYSNNNPPAGVALPTQTTIIVGPVKDRFNNIVAANTPVDINLINGLNISGNQPLATSIIRTNSLGMSSFVLSGANKRGDIIINASSAGASSTLSIWGYEKSRVKYDLSNNNVVFSTLHHSAKENPILEQKWDIIKNGVPMSSLDSNYYGHAKYSDRASTKFGMADSFPYFNWNCSFPAGAYLVYNFCMQPNAEYSPMYKYNTVFNLLLDSPSINDAVELVLNGDFSPQKGLSFWSDFEATKPTGIKHSSDYTGVIWIDNSLYVNPTDSTNKKNFAVSSPIIVDPLKRYVLLFTIKEIIGTTENSNLSFGYINETSDASNPNYVLNNPIIVQEDFGISTLNAQQRVIITPANSNKIRLYFSTKGSGNSASIKLDDVSLRELSTQNIHDLTSIDGVSVAYLSKFDQAVMFGGTVGVQNSPTSYSTINSNQTTVLSRILDPSSGIIINKYPDSSPTDIGTRPSARGFVSMASSTDKIFAYGGLNLSSNSTAMDDFFIWDGSTLKWIKEIITGDSSIPDPDNLGLNVPGKRYQNGLLHIPELNSLYLIGGLSQKNDNWQSKDDLWKIDLSQPAKKWKLICDVCNFVPDNVYSNIGKSWSDLQNSPTANNFNSYINSARSLKTVNSIWHSATQKAYFYIPESSYFKKYDPYTSQFETVPVEGVFDFRGAYKIDYNQEIGRTYGYTRGTVSGNNSKIFFWDMNRDEKQYIKVDFNLEEKAKEYIQEIKINLYAFGSSKTYRPEGTVNESGVELYLFNHQLMNWELVNENNNGTQSSVQAPISFFVNNHTVSDFVSIEGTVSALVVPKGRPGFSGGDPKMGEDLPFVQLKDVTGELAEFKEIYTGYQTTCGVLQNDTLKCWGKNDFGQLGQGNATASIGESANEMSNINPIALFNSSNPAYLGVEIKQITIGQSHTCALLTNNEIKCWGDNTDGKLGAGIAPVGSNIGIGDGSNEMGSNLVSTHLFNAGSPYEILKIEAGLNHTCALIKVSNTGTRNKVKCWGKNDFGQLGNNENRPFGSALSDMYDNLPWLVGVSTFYDSTINSLREGTIVDLAVGNNHNCVVVEGLSGNETLQCWGKNDNNQLSLNNDTSNKKIATSTNIPTIEIMKIKAGGDHTCMNYYDGKFEKFLCFGKNNYGQLGRGGGGIISNELMVNGEFNSPVVNGWATIGSVIPSLVDGKLNFYGGGSGIRQSISNAKVNRKYEFSVDIIEKNQPPVFSLIQNNLPWSTISGIRTINNGLIKLGSTDSALLNNIRSGLIENQIEPLRNYTYRFKIENAEGSPYFKIIDENYNTIIVSDPLNDGDYTYSFGLEGHQDGFYIEWFLSGSQTAEISNMELYKNPASSLPIQLLVYKNVGFNWELFDSVEIKESGTFRREIVSPSNNLRFELVSAAQSSVADQVYVDNVSFKLKNDILVELPLDLDFEFIDFDTMKPIVSTPSILNEVFVPKMFYPNFRAMYQKMLRFESNKQNRILLENFNNLNIGRDDFVIDMEIDPVSFESRSPLISKIGLSNISNVVNNTGGWIYYIGTNRRLTFFAEGLGIVGESQPINEGFQKIRVKRETVSNISKIKFYRNLGLGWDEITVSSVMSNGSPPPNVYNEDFSDDTDAPVVVGSTFDDSPLAGEQRSYGHYDGYIGYIYVKTGSSEIDFIEGLFPNLNILADFTDIGGAELPVDFDLGDNHTCVVSADNNVKCFGDNVGGQVGYGQNVDEYGISIEEMGYKLPNVNLGLNLDIQSIKAGGEFNCVLYVNGSSKCWGRNTFGQLGINTTESHGRGKDNVTGINELKIDYIDLEGIF